MFQVGSHDIAWLRIRIFCKTWHSATLSVEDARMQKPLASFSSHTDYYQRHSSPHTRRPGAHVPSRDLQERVERLEGTKLQMQKLVAVNGQVSLWKSKGYSHNTKPSPIGTY